jgi:hypothetical protein
MAFIYVCEHLQYQGQRRAISDPFFQCNGRVMIGRRVSGDGAFSEVAVG